MQTLAKNNYTAEEVKAVLHGPVQQWSFRYDLLTNQNILKKRLTNMLAASVANNALAEIKRTARFTLVDDGSIDFLTDRIKPWVRLKMTKAVSLGTWSELTQVYTWSAYIKYSWAALSKKQWVTLAGTPNGITWGGM